MNQTYTPHSLIYVPGTRVVATTRINTTIPAGWVGVVINSTGPGDYRIRFQNNEEVTVAASQLVMLAKYKDGESKLDRGELYNHVILQCVIGSQAYGLTDLHSDVDTRGIYLAPAEQHWSLQGVPEQLECDETQECYWELQKFLNLALKANPNVLETLYSPLVMMATPLAEELLALRQIFLSKLLYQTFNGYVMSQFKKIQQDIRNQGAVKWKHAMHLIRLLITGTTALREHHLPVRVNDQHRDKLLSIKHGDMPWVELDRWRLALHAAFDHAYTLTTLPDRPDIKRANDFLIRARRWSANQ